MNIIARAFQNPIIHHGRMTHLNAQVRIFCSFNLRFRPSTFPSIPLNSLKYLRKRLFFSSDSESQFCPPGADYLLLTPIAIAKLNEIQHLHNSDRYLRLSVDAGGCHGFKYALELVSQPHPNDIIIERLGAKVSIEQTSLKLIKGSTIDYIRELVFTGFRIVSNPNVKASCGCKVSFDADL